MLGIRLIGAVLLAAVLSVARPAAAEVTVLDNGVRLVEVEPASDQVAGLCVGFAVPEGWLGPPELPAPGGWRTAECQAAGQDIERLGAKLGFEKWPGCLLIQAMGLPESVVAVARSVGRLVPRLAEEVAASAGQPVPSTDVISDVHNAALAGMFGIVQQRSPAAQYARAVCGRRCGVAIAAPHDMAAQVVRALGIGNLPAGTAPVWQAAHPRSGSVLLRHPGVSEWVMVCFAGPRWDDADEATLAVIEALLSSGNSGLLFRELRRDRGLAYRVGAQWGPDRTWSHLGIWAVTEVGQARQAMVGVRQVLDGLRRGVESPDFERARQRVMLSRALAEQSTANRVARAARGLALEMPSRVWDGTSYANAASKVTEEDVRRVAAKYLTGGYVVVSTPAASGPGGRVVFAAGEEA